MRILIELPTWLGDAVMATPAIENLINFHDGSEFILIGSETSIEILKYHPKITKVYKLEKTYLSLFSLRRLLGKFDFFYSFRNSFRSNLFRIFIKSNFKFTFNRKLFKSFHQVEKYNKFINKSLAANFSAGPLLIYQNNKPIEPNDEIKKSKPILGINPGSSYGSAKRWYPNEFAKVASSLSDKYDVVIIGGKNEEKIASDIEKYLIKHRVENFQNFAGKTNLDELVDLVSNCNLFITGDSGPMHIAASFNIPTISIFGPTNFIETSQWQNDKSIILNKELKCQPCMKKTCPLLHHKCMKLIKADDVLDKVNNLNLQTLNL